MTDARYASPEKRLATFVKCDIVDSTRLANALDLEDQRTLSQEFRKAIARAAEAESGHIMRFEGDAALLSFGHPEACEDAAECAVRAGLAIVSEVKAIRLVPDLRLDIRVGIASGEVAVGDIIDKGDRFEHAVDGPVPAMAERLRAAGEPGHVLVSDATQRLCGRFFDYIDLGVIAAKGFEQGLRAWRVLGPTEVSSSFEARRLADETGAIIGRDAPMAALAAAWRLSFDGRGQALALVGDAGMGKSRLVHEVHQMAARDAATILRLDCTPRAGNSPLYPIGLLLRRLAGIDAGMAPPARRAAATALLERVLDETEASDALRYLGPLLGVADAALPPGLMPNEVRDRTVASCVRLLHALAAREPVMLVCEDLHWADATTLSVLQEIARQVAEIRCLLLVTSRTMQDVQLAWPRFQQIELQPLDEADAGRLVAAVTRTLDAAVARRIVARGAGVPLYLVEIASETRSAIEQGLAPSDASVPASLKLVVQSRLGRWPALKQIVHAASALDGEFPVELLVRMMKDRGDDVAPAISLLSQHGIFRPWDPADDRIAFKHATIRDAVYDTMLRTERSAWHSIAADLLASHFGGTPDSSADALAFHLVESQRFAEAVRIRLAAASETAARGAFVESVGHCDAGLAAIDRLEGVPDAALLHVSLLVQRALALSAQHGFAATLVEKAYELAAAQVDADTPALVRYPISRGQAAVHLVRGHLDQAHRFAGEGIAIAEQSGQAAHRLDALSLRLYTTLYTDTLGECRRLVDQFMGLYDAEGGEHLTYPAPQEAKTSVLALLPTIAWLLGDDAGAEKAIRDGQAHVEKLGRPFDQAMLHAWIAGIRYTQRRYLDCQKHAAEAIRIAAPRGYSDWSNTGGLLALLAQATSQPTPETVGMARGALMMLDAQGVGLNASWHRWAVAQACAAMEDWDGAQAMVTEGQARALASNERRLDAELLLLEAGLPHNAPRKRALLKKSIAAANALGDVATALRATATLVEGAEELESIGAPRFARGVLHRLAHTADGSSHGPWMAQDLQELVEQQLKHQFHVSAMPPWVLKAATTLAPPISSAWVQGATQVVAVSGPLDRKNFKGDCDPQPKKVSDGGQSTYAGSVFTLLLPRVDVAKVLPSGFVLADRNTPSAQHPVICMLGLQHDCCFMVNGATSPADQKAYTELIVLVPYVVQKGGGDRWHNFSVRMFLDAVAPIIIGDLSIFQYSKTEGSFDATATTTTGPFPVVQDEVEMTPLGVPATLVYRDASLQKANWVSANAAPPAFGALMDVMAMPILGVEFDPIVPPATPWACSYFEWDVTGGQVAAMEGSVQFIQAFRTGMESWVSNPPAWIAADTASSFLVQDFRWRLSQDPPPCVF